MYDVGARKALYLGVNGISLKVLIDDTIVYDRHFKWSSHPSHVKVQTLSTQVRPRKSNKWPPAQQSSNLPTEPILPQSEKNIIMHL